MNSPISNDYVMVPRELLQNYEREYDKSPDLLLRRKYRDQLFALLTAPAPPSAQDKAEAGRWIPFNVNAKVRFKITDCGQQKIDAKDAELNDFIAARGGKPIGPRYRKDADGWSETQLWCLMEDLGQFCHLGGDPPFETTILLDAGELPK